MVKILTTKLKTIKSEEFFFTQKETKTEADSDYLESGDGVGKRALTDTKHQRLP